MFLTMLPELEKLEKDPELDGVRPHADGSAGTWKVAHSYPAFLDISLPEENHLAWGYSPYPMTNQYGGIKALPSCPNLRQFCKTIPTSSSSWGWLSPSLQRHDGWTSPSANPALSGPFYRCCPPNTLTNFLPANPTLRAGFPWNPT